MDRPRLRSVFAALALLAGDPTWMVRGLKIRPSRTECVVCGKAIPPGKPGRKCEECRKE